MAKKAKTNPKAEAAPGALNMAILANVVAATRAGSYVLATKDEMSAYVLPASDPALVEFNDTVSDPANPARIAFRATEAGIAAADAANAPAPATPPAAEEGAKVETFTIDDNVPLPTIRRGGNLGGRVSKYPFDGLGAPVKNVDGSLASAKSFFIAATAALPNPAKTLASTVSAASKKYARKGPDGQPIKDAEGNMTFERKFTIRAVDEPGRGKGARVWRVL